MSSRFTQIGGELVPFRKTFVSGTAVVCGTTSTAVTVPAGANNALISARGGAIYYTVNGSAAGTTSGGYVAANSVQPVFTVDNLNSLHVAGEAASVAHIQFYNE